MYVIRLPNGNLRVPQTAIRVDGHSRVIGDAYIEIGPQDADYERLAAQAITPDQMEERRAAWRAGDAALKREFLEFARLVGDQDWTGQREERDDWLTGRPKTGRPRGKLAVMRPKRECGNTPRGGAPPTMTATRRKGRSQSDDRASLR